MPVTEVEATIRDYIQSALAAASPDELDVDTQLLESNLLDSLGIYELVVFLEQRYEIEILDEEVVPENFSTIASLAELVGAKR